jgi:hypothetical protein
MQPDSIVFKLVIKLQMLLKVISISYKLIKTIIFIINFLLQLMDNSNNSNNCQWIKVNLIAYLYNHQLIYQVHLVFQGIHSTTEEQFNFVNY